MKTLSRILRRLGIVVGAAGLIAILWAFAVNYRAITAYDPSRKLANIGASR